MIPTTAVQPHTLTDQQAQAAIGALLGSAAGDALGAPFGLEEKWLASLKGLEITVASRLPEVDFCDGWVGRQESPPVAVGDTHIRLHISNRSCLLLLSNRHWN